MSWVITGTYKGAAVSDPDAQAYLRAVEQADNQGPLEQGVQQAVNQFVIGCKADGIWTAIKASCILASARTLAGALVPLVGAAPTNVDGNFVEGDYDRKTGLVGNGSTKYLDSNRNNNADPQDSYHLSCFISVAHTAGIVGPYIHSNTRLTGASGFGRSGAETSDLFTRNRQAASQRTDGGASTGFIATNRSESANYSMRFGAANTTITQASESPANASIFVFGHDSNRTDARLAFYSIGESLDLALLDARVTTLIQAIDAAI
jgi:hypothetical protein